MKHFVLNSHNFSKIPFYAENIWFYTALHASDATHSHQCSTTVAQLWTNGQAVQFSAMKTAVRSTASRSQDVLGYAAGEARECRKSVRQKRDVLAMYIFTEKSHSRWMPKRQTSLAGDAKSCSTCSGHVGSWCRRCDNAYLRVLSSPC